MAQETVKSQPIASYGLLGDGKTAALVSQDGSIDWWCQPRFDSPSLFGRLLDPSAGHWTIHPTGRSEARRHYVPGTLVLVTELRTADGVVEITDAMALDRAEPHQLGRGPTQALVRRVRGLEGDVDVAVEVVPRSGYGRHPARMRRGELGIEISPEPGGGPLLLTSDRPLDIVGGGDAHGNQLSAVMRMRRGDEVGFVLGPGSVGRQPPNADSALTDTVATWQAWSAAHDRYDGAYAEVVRQSSLVLQALTYQPAGAIVAAATTSLPEIPGGPANWDYRYAWLRDAAMVLRALWVGACPDEADRYFGWIADAVAADDDRLQVVYGVAGERQLPETELPHLAGYCGSRPVRVGNDAWSQRQLDVPGEVIDAAWTLRDRLEADGRVGDLVGRLSDLAADTWQEPDAGIWEGREGERHYVSSKLMCWVALDRALRLAPQLGVVRDTGRWRAERERIRQSILDDGWNPAVGSFTGAFGSDHLDASLLLMPLVGFLPAGDPRMAATIDAIERELGEQGLVRRWTGAEEEGAFVWCSYWLAECHARAGRVDRAAEIFEHVSAHANDLGLLAEMIDPRTGDLLGNFPQALSHAGLICAAWSIDRARSPNQSATHPRDHEEQ